MFVKERNKIPLPSTNIKVRIALVYPNVYEMGMSSYTIHLLYSLFNSYSGIRCERFFLPKNKDTKGALRSIDSGSKLDDFDVIAFSIHYELDYMNVLWILENLDIPFYGEKRKSEEYPLIIAGGSAVKSNPLILLPFIDILVFSDLEPIFDLFCKNLVEFSEENRSFNQILSVGSKWQQIFMSLPNTIISKIALEHLTTNKSQLSSFPVNRQHLRNMDESACPTMQILPQFKNNDNKLVFGETFLLEINRGCPSGCRFCLTGYVNRPFRNRSFSQIKQIIDDSIIQTGAKKITLIGSAVADHPKFKEICQYIVDKNLQVMIPSIRIDKINKEILTILRQGGVRSLTIAPETGSDILRKKLNKGLSNSDIIQRCVEIYSLGFQSIKMYFLVGLPFESQKDVSAITNLVKKIHDNAGKIIPKRGIRLSVNPFIPKLFTPYNSFTENFIKTKMEYLRKVEKVLTSELKNISNVEIEFLNWKEARLQAIFSQLDESFGPILVEFYQMGALPITMKKLDTIHKNIVTNYLQDTIDVFGKKSSTQMNKLNQLINMGFKKGYLLQEEKNAEKGKILGCNDNCHRCGICR